ncbi:MAG: hypothetical protein PHU46_15755 [Rhodocyclaceae bacterium]|nr:hypothetical protein [Rhodocyclaceae bacterium]
MHPIHDVDVILLLALALSSKRRPAALFEIVAAADLIYGAIPSESKMIEGFSRLASHGLIVEAEGGYTLTADAQKIMAGGPRKPDTAKRIFAVKEKLSAYTPQGEHAPILLTAEQLSEAILAHRNSGVGAGRNLLVPKPKAEPTKRPRYWGKPGTMRGRKA